jgi:hypothetical protein
MPVWPSIRGRTHTLAPAAGVASVSSSGGASLGRPAMHRIGLMNQLRFTFAYG